MIQRPLLAILLLALCGFACTPEVTEPPPPPPPQINPPAPNTIWVMPDEKPDGKVIFGNIADAIKAAGGKHIHVSPGVYKETLTIPNDSIVHITSDPKNPAKLVVPDEKTGIAVGAKAQLMLRHFAIEGGERGITVAKGSHLNAIDVRFRNIKGQAIFATEATLQVAQCQFTDILPASEERKKIIGDPNGISIKQSHLQLHDSQFTTAGSKAVLLQNNSNADISRCQFTHLKTGAISAIATESGSYTSIHNVEIKGWKEALFFNAATGSVDATKIEDARGNAIFATKQSWVRIEKTTILRPKQSGVSFSISAGVVRNSQIDDAGEFGVFSTGGQDQQLILIEGNKVNRCKGAGIQVFVTRAEIRKNVVTQSQVGAAGDDGNCIGALDSDQITLVDNEVKGCVGAGIFFNRSGGLIDNNRVNDNKEIGIFITNLNAVPELRLTLQNNEVTGNKVAGVFMLASNIVMRKNTIKATVFSDAEQSGSGVVVFGRSNVDIAEDTYENNGEHGILIAQSSNATIKDSTIKGNKGYGVLVQCGSSKLTQEGNTYENNKRGAANKCP